MNEILFFRLRSVVFAILASLLVLTGCQSASGDKPSFQNIGEFTVKSLPDHCKEVTDGMGRRLILVPRGQKPPEGYEKHQIIEVPVQRGVAYSTTDVAILKALGIVAEVLVGVTRDKEEWTVPEVIQGMENGKITYLGQPDAIDLERLKAIRPELVLTWDQAIIPMLRELDIPCVITSTGMAKDLDTRVRFVQFLAPFFNREPEAKLFVARVSRAVERLEKISASAQNHPKVIWGDIFEKRVRVEPGNSWAAEMVRLAGGEYLFEDIFGAS